MSEPRSESPSPQQQAKIALEAYKIWEQEGRPQGRYQDFLRMAENLVQQSEKRVECEPTQNLANANLNLNIALALMQ